MNKEIRKTKERIKYCRQWEKKDPVYKTIRIELERKLKELVALDKAFNKPLTLLGKLKKFFNI